MPSQKIILKYDRKTIEVDGRKANEDLENIDLAKDALDRFNNDELDIAALEEAYPQEWAQFLQVMELYAAGRWIQPEYWAQILAVILTMLKEISNGDFDDSLYTDFQGNRLGGSAPERPRTAPIIHAWIEIGENKMIFKPAKKANDPSAWVVLSGEAGIYNGGTLSVYPNHWTGAAQGRCRVLPVDSKTFIIVHTGIERLKGGRYGQAGTAILCSPTQVKEIRRPPMPGQIFPGAYPAGDAPYRGTDYRYEIDKQIPFGVGAETKPGIFDAVPVSFFPPYGNYRTVPSNYYFPAHESTDGRAEMVYQNYIPSQGTPNTTYSMLFKKTAWYPISPQGNGVDIPKCFFYDAAGHRQRKSYPPSGVWSGLWGNTICAWESGSGGGIRVGWDYNFYATHTISDGAFGTPANIALWAQVTTPEQLEQWCTSRVSGGKRVYVAPVNDNYFTRSLDRAPETRYVPGTIVQLNAAVVSDRQFTGRSVEPMWYEAIESPKDVNMTFTLTSDTGDLRKVRTSDVTTGYTDAQDYDLSEVINQDAAQNFAGTGFGKDSKGLYDIGWYWPTGQVKQPTEGDINYTIKLRPQDIPSKTLNPIPPTAFAGLPTKDAGYWCYYYDDVSIWPTNDVRFYVEQSYNQCAVFSYAAGRSWRDELIALGFDEADLRFE